MNDIHNENKITITPDLYNITIKNLKLESYHFLSSYFLISKFERVYYG
jgi:hypothetical protein